MIDVNPKLYEPCEIYDVPDNSYLSLEMSYMLNVESLAKCNIDKETIKKSIEEMKVLYGERTGL